MSKIVKRILHWDEDTNEIVLITKYEDGSIESEPLTVQESAEWMAQNKF